MPTTVYSRAFTRAAQLLGGVEKLRAHLGVGMAQLNFWLRGQAKPPDAVFLKVVDLLSEHEKQEMLGRVRRP
ncbi:MAG: hypothetical protein K0R40_1869 [Burkholderiales bacterium]|nr:hypothetical protein [Burkholderiales bacterium]